MRFLLLCKRHYTQRDLLADRYGRLYHLPLRLGEIGNEGLVLAMDYKGGSALVIDEPGVKFKSIPISKVRWPAFLRTARRAAREFGPDVVIASADIHIGLIGRMVARALKVPFVFDVYDDYETFASARFPGFKGLYRRLLRSADLVTVVGRPLAEQAAKYTTNYAVIGNGVDQAVFRPRRREETRSALGLPLDETIIGYFGAIDATRGVDVLSEACRTLRSEGRNIRLLLAGTLASEIDLDAEADYRGFVSQSEVADLIAACNVVVIPYFSEPRIDKSSAAKIAEYLACEVPIVTTDVADYAAEMQAPPRIVCRPGDVAGMAEAIRSQIDDPLILQMPAEMNWIEIGDALAARLTELVAGHPD